MPTKAIVVGQTPNKLKPIELNFVLHQNAEFRRGFFYPVSYKFVELISKNYLMHDGAMRDLIFAYNDENTRQGSMYLGKWNDGVVQDLE